MSSVALIGDSHTEITFPMVKTLLEQAGHSVTNMVSKIGWATYSFNNEPSYFSTLLQQDPSTVVVSLGGNNSKLSDSYGQSVMEFLSNIGYPSRKVIWISPAKAIREDVEKRHDWTSNWLKRNLPKDVVFIDARPHTTTGHKNDGVHFSRSAYRQWVDGISSQLLSSISLPPVLYKAKKATPYILLIIALSGLGYATWRRFR